MKLNLRILSSLLLLTLAAAVPWTTAEAQPPAELLGGWVIESWEAPAGQTGPNPQRGLFVFTASGHYSIMFVVGDAREPVGPDPSDANLAAAYGPFVANSGRYSVAGNQITYEAFVAKDPAYMSRFAPTGGEGNAQTIDFSFDSDRLVLRFGEGGPMNQATATLRRPGE